MKVVGYDQAKNVIATSLPPGRVARLKIDPYRVDLFDDNPVVLEVKLKSGKRSKLNFTRLLPVTFGYHRSAPPRRGGRAYLGSFDGRSASCISGKVVSDDREELRLAADSVKQEDFQQHFGEFLRRAARLRRRDDSWEPCIEAGLKPLETTDAIELRNNEVHFDCAFPVDLFVVPGPAIPVFRYAGRMFDEQPVPIALPDSINLVLRHFASLDPIVFGECLALALLGQPIQQVSLMVDGRLFEQKYGRVDQQPIENLARELTQLYGSPWCSAVPARQLDIDEPVTASFYIGGILYQLSVGGTGIRSPRETCRDKIGLGAYQLTATACDAVLATRIALHDLSFKRTRWIRKVERREDRRAWMNASRPLEMARLNFQPIPKQLPSLWLGKSPRGPLWLSDDKKNSAELPSGRRLA